MLKVIHFFAVNCDLCFYSLLQIIVASPAKLCSIKVAATDLRRLHSVDIRQAREG